MATHAVPPPDAQLVTLQPLQVRHRAYAVVCCILSADVLAILVARLPVELLHPGRWVADRPAQLFISLLTFISVLAFSGLYRRTSGNPAVELKRLILAVSFYYLCDELFPALSRHEHLPSLALLVTGWSSSVVLILLFRYVVRRLFSSTFWWSAPAVVFYTGDDSLRLVKYLRQHAECGIKPIAVLVPDEKLGLRLGLPTFPYRQAKILRQAGVTRAIVVHSDHGTHVPLESIEQWESMFPHLFILGGFDQFYTLNVSAFEIGHSLAVEVQRKSLSQSATFAKRMMELVLVLLVAPFVGLVVLAIMLLVRLDSPGPVFFGHTRIGRDQRPFKAWKIRSMKVDAAELLETLLAEDPAAREEWERDRKLRDDPRVTRIGKWLRRTSVDEIPQLWNVLRGEMSLVGPRPIIQEEAAMYGHRFPLYCRVTPGITGLWQVSGRNTTTVSERVQLDVYYVRNWSPWLDLHILIRTAQTVLSGRGAY